MSDNTQVFQQILMPGEEIQRVFKPHKGRFWASRLLGHLPGLLITVAILGLIAWAISSDIAEASGLDAWVMIAAILGFTLGPTILWFGLEMLMGAMWYKNRWYCYTNRRIIIQCGVLARNFRFMDLNWAANSFVRISVLDRMLGKNTGSIKFSSMASPMMGHMHMGVGAMRGTPGFSTMFYFLYVQNPHDILRDIQEKAMAVQNAGGAQMNNLANQIGHLANNINNMQGGNQQGWNNQQGNNQNWNNNQQQQGWNNNNNNQQQNWNNQQNQQGFNQNQNNFNNNPNQNNWNNNNNNNDGGW